MCPGNALIAAKEHVGAFVRFRFEVFALDTNQSPVSIILFVVFCRRQILRAGETVIALESGAKIRDRLACVSPRGPWTSPRNARLLLAGFLGLFGTVACLDFFESDGTWKTRRFNFFVSLCSRGRAPLVVHARGPTMPPDVRYLFFAREPKNGGPGRQL